MKIAIVGGGFTGLSAAYTLTKEGHTVTVFEKEAYLGGLAFGFKQKNWDWNLEFAYHHLFTNDDAILELLTELGLKEKIIIKRPITATLFEEEPYQLDSVRSLLTFPGLPFIDRVRTGAFIAALKYNPFWQPLEHLTAASIAKQLGGKVGWDVIWEPLLVGKFGKYAPDIAASWLWARIKKRTPSLAYIEGGFQTLVTQLSKTIEKQGGTILTSTMITKITQDKGTFTITYGNKKQRFDKVLLTLPTPLAVKLVPELLTTHHSQPTTHPSTSSSHRLRELSDSKRSRAPSRDNLEKALSIPHLHAQVLILETKEPILNDIYWLNITDKRYPFLALVAHTNYMDKRHYGGNHIAYIGNYLPPTHPYVSLSKEELLKKFLPYLKKINPTLKKDLTIISAHLFTGPFAQPVHTKHYSRQAPPLKTSIPGMYMANMDSIYPWDRGTNYAVESGKKAAETMLDK